MSGDLRRWSLARSEKEGMNNLDYSENRTGTFWLLFLMSVTFEQPLCSIALSDLHIVYDVATFVGSRTACKSSEGS